MSKLKNKFKETVGYDNIVRNRDLMRYAKFNQKDLFIGLITGFLGFSFMIVNTNILWLTIIVKIIGIGMMINAFGLILGCFKFDEFMQDKLDQKKK